MKKYVLVIALVISVLCTSCFLLVGCDNMMDINTDVWQGVDMSNINEVIAQIHVLLSKKNYSAETRFPNGGRFEHIRQERDSNNMHDVIELYPQNSNEKEHHIESLLLSKDNNISKFIEIVDGNNVDVDNATFFDELDSAHNMNVRLVDDMLKGEWIYDKESNTYSKPSALSHNLTTILSFSKDGFKISDEPHSSRYSIYIHYFDIGRTKVRSKI